jgi:hypothetical protein
MLDHFWISKYRSFKGCKGIRNVDEVRIVPNERGCHFRTFSDLEDSTGGCHLMNLVIQ